VTTSVVSASPDLKSQYGILDVTFTLQTATDSQGVVRYCYVTNTGLEAPTLRVNPGDQLIIHFTNNLPANVPSRTGDNMAGMNMTLSSEDTPQRARVPHAKARCRQAQPISTFTEPMWRQSADRMKWFIH
jgi:FtsP/CotA-like multicopper oxidase with cupredoxin domain